MNIRIGTRGSLLALWQANFIKNQLENKGLKTEIIIIETKGDKILDKTLAKIGSKGVFTEELETQLLNGSIDIAVHSAKDLQSDLGKELEIIAFSEREKTNDVLISHLHKLNLQSNEIVIGTSSTRRVALLKANFPKSKIVDMRGNLQTRIKKMEAGVCDALILAFAGVHRMQYDNLIIHEFSTTDLVPPVGQGTIAIESSKKLELEKKIAIRSICNHPETENCLLAERQYLNVLKGGCSIPVFGNAICINSKISFTAGIISLDGKDKIQETIFQNLESAEEIGTIMAEKILNLGGKEILEKIKNQLQ